MYLILILVILLIGFSCRFNWWRQSKDGIPILMYHHIDIPPKDEKNKKLWVTAKKFNQHLAYLKKHGYSSITFRDLMRHIQEGNPLPVNPVIITFDDGAEDIYLNGFPILKKYDFRACIFLVTEGSTLKIDQLKEMKDYGIEFGSHTKTHPNLLNTNDDKLREEIWESKKILEERLNTEIIVFAYPYGQGAYNEKIKQVVKEAGYFFACGIRRGIQTLPINNPFSLNRILIRGDDFIIDLILKLKKGASRL